MLPAPPTLTAECKNKDTIPQKGTQHCPVLLSHEKPALDPKEPHPSHLALLARSHQPIVYSVASHTPYKQELMCSEKPSGNHL